jgi:hypothetical protein
LKIADKMTLGRADDAGALPHSLASIPGQRMRHFMAENGVRCFYG